MHTTTFSSLIPVPVPKASPFCFPTPVPVSVAKAPVSVYPSKQRRPISRRDACTPAAARQLSPPHTHRAFRPPPLPWKLSVSLFLFMPCFNHMQISNRRFYFIIVPPHTQRFPCFPTPLALKVVCFAVFIHALLLSPDNQLFGVFIIQKVINCPHPTHVALSLPPLLPTPCLYHLTIICFAVS